MRIAIVDDDKSFIEQLADKVEHICIKNALSCEIEFYNDSAIIEEYDNYDLIFLDIKMPKKDGISIAREINDAKKSSELPYIVFVTSSQNLVFSALKTFPLSFIRKTEVFINNDIENCILNVSKRINEEPKKYQIYSDKKIVRLDYRDIIYIEKLKNYVIFYTTRGEYQERSNIRAKESDLLPHNFFRVHIGYIVNPIHIHSLCNNDILLDNGDLIPVSNTYRQIVEDYCSKHNIKH